ncbi:MAG: ChbG/HpnK family deacetylase [Halobacteriovoraceae bacterium]|jgi:chitin disaccharide deacetylase|nr:ChbG/HpnK family deacetylase [Halobacteriovoraceae bacterium]
MKSLIACLFLLLHTTLHAEGLEVRLGYPAGTKLLIINADDHGMSNAENKGTMEVLKAGLVTSATMMVPPGWSHDAMKEAVRSERKNLGVHVTLTSEWSKYRWRPLTSGNNGKSTLTNKQGHFWETSKQVEQNASVEDVEREVRAQLDAVLKRGIELSHFDSHMGSLYGLETGRVELLATALALSYEYGLPFRLPKHPLTMRFESQGFILLDKLIMGDNPSKPAERRAWFISEIKKIKAGVTELFIHPAIETPEIKRITGRWATRVMEKDLFTSEEMKNLLTEQGIVLIDYTKLKTLQRKQMAWRPTFHYDQVYKKYLGMLGGF